MNLQGKIILQGEKNKIAKKINSQEKKLKLREKLKLYEKSKNYQTSYKRKITLKNPSNEKTIGDTLRYGRSYRV